MYRESRGGSGLRNIPVSWVDQRGGKLEQYLGDGRNQRAERRKEGTLVGEFNINPLIHVAL